MSNYIFGSSRRTDRIPRRFATGVPRTLNSEPYPSHMPSSSTGTVYLLDDELEMVKALTRLLRAKRFDVRGFVSVDAFLKAYSPQECACLVLDVAMPELDGLELQRRLTQQKIPLPIIFLTGCGDIPMSVRAIKAGATDFLTKPVDAAALVSAVRVALQVAGRRSRRPRC